MIPLRDNIPARNFPVVNTLLIAACGITFLLQLGDSSGTMVERLGMIPARVLDGDAEVLVRDVTVTRFGAVREYLRPAEPPPFPAIFTLLSCIFLHGGWLHLLGNMWFLYIFGDNVEDRLGPGKYLLFYLGCGVAASFTHYISGPGSTLPTLGASGAVAGVMGAYFLLYPRAQVVTLVPIFIFIQIMVLPAWVFLAFWFVIQFFSGAIAISSVKSGGVAWWAHVGGFAAH